MSPHRSYTHDSHDEVNHQTSNEGNKRRIAVSHPAFVGNESAYVMQCLESSWIAAGGPFVDRFEREFAKHLNCESAVSTNSGTSALHLALLAIGIKPGDEVIVPTLTYIASANAVVYCGGTPVFVDSLRPSLGMDPACVEAAITPRTKAILPVHLYGHPADMQPLLEIADRHGLYVIEDAAEALGATYHGKAAGTLGTCGAFSFFGNKTLTTGQGGMVTTNDPAVAARMRLFREQGADPNKRYWSSVIGYNYRMTNIEAAIGLAQLEKIDYHLAARASVARWYAERLKGLEETIILPHVQAGVHHSFWMYVIEFRTSARIDRDAVISAMSEQNIETRPGFYPAHTMPPYFDPIVSTAVAEEVGRNTICLPTHALLTELDVDRVVAQLRNIIGNLNRATALSRGNVI